LVELVGEHVALSAVRCIYVGKTHVGIVCIDDSEWPDLARWREGGDDR
jgi:hypothetical protein